MLSTGLCEQFLKEVARSRSNALLLDYDGTLSPFTANRTHAYPYPPVPELLRKISTSGRTRVVLITGRTARDLRSLLGVHPAPEIWGVHGLERLWPNGEYQLADIGINSKRGLNEAAAWLEREGLQQRAEFKPGSIAIHWRGLSDPAVAELRTCIQRIWQPIAESKDLCLQEFDGGMEIRASVRDKGDAVRTILSELQPGVPVAYLGDDRTDEKAFRALADRGLTVLVRPEFRATAASAWLKPPEELIEFLSEWLRASGGEAQ